MKKRILSLCLALCLVVGLLPAIALAAELPATAGVKLPTSLAATAELTAAKGTVAYATLKDGFFDAESVTTTEPAAWTFALDNKNGETPVLYVDLDGKTLANSESGAINSGSYDHDLEVVFLSAATLSGKRMITWANGSLTLTGKNGAELYAIADKGTAANSYAGIGMTKAGGTLTIKNLVAMVEAQPSQQSSTIYTAGGDVVIENSYLYLISNSGIANSKAIWLKTSGNLAIKNSTVLMEADSQGIMVDKGDIAITDSTVAIDHNMGMKSASVTGTGANAICATNGNLNIEDSVVVAYSHNINLNYETDDTLYSVLYTGTPVLKVAKTTMEFNIKNSYVEVATATYVHGVGKEMSGEGLQLVYANQSDWCKADNGRSDWGGMVVHSSHKAPTFTDATAVGVKNLSVGADNKFVAPNADDVANNISDLMYLEVTPKTTEEVTIPALVAGVAASGKGWSYDGAILLTNGNYTYKFSNATLSNTGAEQKLLPIEATNADLTFSMTENGEYGYDVPTAKDAGTYKVWYKFGDGAAQSVEITISAGQVTPPPHEHSYSDWTDCEDGKNHKKVCACGEDTITEAHKWDAGTETVKPEVGKKGTKTFTCSECGAKKTEDIPALKEEVQPPKTGDNSHLALFAVLTVLTVAGVAVIGKKKYMA